MKKQLILPIIFTLFLVAGNVFSQLKIGDVAPALPELKVLYREFPDLENKFVFLDFWSTYHSSDIRSLEHLNQLALRFQKRVIYLAITDENEEKVLSFLQNKHWYNIFFGIDKDAIYHKNFSVEIIPVYYLISPDHIILSTGVSAELKDYKLDSIINKVDSLRQIKFTGMNILKTK